MLAAFSCFVVNCFVALADCLQPCTIGNSRSYATTYEVLDTFPSGTVIYSLPLEPRDADTGSLHFQGDLSERYRDKFLLKKLSKGYVELISNGTLQLPKYPYASIQAHLNVYFFCNGNWLTMPSLKINATNRFAPVWYLKPYVLSVEEATRPGTLLKTPVLCVDWDPFPTYEVNFKISSGNEEEAFAVTTVKGQRYLLETLPSNFTKAQQWRNEQLPHYVYLKLLKPLDYDYGTRVYYLNITAEDQSLSLRRRSSRSTIIVHVMDSDDLPPVLSSARYYGVVHLNSSSGTEVHLSPAISARDGDPYIDAPVYFKLEDSSSSFVINETTGQLYLGQSAIAATASYAELKVKAVQRDNPSMYSTSAIHLRFVKSVAQAQRSLCRLSVQMPRKGDVVARLLAKDGSPDVKFTLQMDDEQYNDAFYLISDGDGVLVKSRLPPGETRGARLLFKILTRPPNLPFFIEGGSNQSAGVCTAAVLAVVWPSLGAQQELRVQENTTVIDVEYKHNAVLFIRENHQPSHVYQVSPCSKGGKARCKFKIVNTNQSQIIIGNDGWIDVVEPFDYESQREVRLNISVCSDDAHDCAYVSLLIFVVDENDNRPAFEQSVYESTIPTFFGCRQRVLQVRATDLDSGSNGLVTYALQKPVGQFMLDYYSGWILTTVDPNQVGIFNFTVVAFDHGAVVEKAYCTVLINVVEQSRRFPVFEQNAYRAKVMENSHPKTGVIQVKAVVPLSSNASVLYSLEKIGSLPFTIDPQSGLISTIKSLDYEEASNYTLEVRAIGAHRAARSSTVLIDVIDVNDNAPVFQPMPEHLVLTKSTTPAGLLFVVVATDADSDLDGNNNVEYELYNPAGGPIAIDSHSGQLSLQSAPDAEKNFTIEIVAKDHGRVPLNASRLLKIYFVTNTAGWPLFHFTQYNVVATPCRNNLTAIRRFHAALQNDVCTYELHPSMVDLQVDNSTGILFSTASYCCQNDTRLTAVVRAKPSKYPSRFSDVAVTILSRVHSSKRIRFVAPVFYGIIHEEVPVGVHLGLCAVLEEEFTNLDVLFSIEENDFFAIDARGCLVSKHLLNLESVESGQHTFCLNVTAAHGEAMCAASFRIKVEDVNEFPPRFAQSVYRVAVPENCSPGQRLLTVSAVDLDVTDKNLTYSIVDGTHSDLVEVGADGVLYKSPSRPFDRERENFIRIQLLVQDRGNLSDSVDVEFEIQDVNDNAPYFLSTPYSWTIVEGMAGIGSSISLQCEDLDADENGTVSFRLLPTFVQHQFHVQKISLDTVTLTLVKPVDREEVEKMLIVIEARDHGNPPLISAAPVEVEVLDVNDNAPKFWQSAAEVQIPCELPVFVPFLRLRAADLDSTSSLAYSIDDENSDFLLHSAADPLLSLRKKAEDLAIFSRVHLTVSDGQFFDNMTVIVQIICHCEDQAIVEVWNETFYKNESPQANSFVGTLGVGDASSGPAAIFPFFMKTAFNIDQAGRIHTNFPLAYSADENWNIFIAVYCGDLNKSTKLIQINVLTMDVNDHPPTFQQIMGSETLPLSAAVGRPLSTNFVATDVYDVGINAMVRYTLAGENASCFEIHPLTSRVSLVCKMHPGVRWLNFVVVATDSNGTGLKTTLGHRVLFATVEDYLKDWTTRDDVATPTTSSCASLLINNTANVTLPRNAPAGTIVYLLSTLLKNEHEKLNYQLFSSGLALPFVLSERNGILATADKMTLDHREEFNFPVIVSRLDGSLSCALRLNVIFVNNARVDEDSFAFEKRIFNFVFDKNNSSDLFIGALSNNCEDDWPALTYSILGVIQLVKLPIYVDSRGDLFATETLRNFVDIGELHFLVQANCSGQLDNALVNLTISPAAHGRCAAFSQPSFTFTLPEGSYVGDFLIDHVTARYYTNDSIAYKINGQNQSLPFRVDERSGDIFVTDQIDREESDEFSFTLIATSNDSVIFNCSAVVFVKVTDVNDNSPIFLNPPDRLSLKSSGYHHDDKVCEMYARDPDVGLNGSVEYSILDGSEYFTIDDNGTVRSKLPWNQLAAGEYKITVSAIDRGHPPLSTNHTISLWLENEELTTKHIVGSRFYEDEEANGFGSNITAWMNRTVFAGGDMFAKKEYWTKLGENLPPLQMLIDLNCTLELQRLPCHYTIQDGGKDKFTIDSASGKIFTAQSLDRENQSLHILLVRCAPPLHRSIRSVSQVNITGLFDVPFDSTLVVVDVIDANDNAPVFEQPEEMAVFYLNLKLKPSGCKIGSVTAVDPDVSSVVTYSADSSADGKLFYVEPKSGLISCSNWNRLREDKHLYRFSIYASDSLYIAKKDVAIIATGQNCGVTLTALRNAEYLLSYLKVIEAKISDMKGYRVHLDNVRPLKSVLTTGSEVDVCAVKKDSLKFVHPSILHSDLENVLPLLQEQLHHLRLLSVDLDAAYFNIPDQEDHGQSLSWFLSGVDNTLIGLISGLIFLILLLLVAMVRVCSKRSVRRLSVSSVQHTQASSFVLRSGKQYVSVDY